MQEGDFEMKHIDKVGSQSFNVAIAPFSLSILGDDTDTLWETTCGFFTWKDGELTWGYQIEGLGNFFLTFLPCKCKNQRV